MDKTINYLIGLFGLILTLIILSDWISLAHLEKTYHLLQQTQKEKELIFSQKLGNSVKGNHTSPPQLINETEVIYQLTTLCDSFHIFIKKMALKKPITKTCNQFEISLELLSEYHRFIDLMNQLIALGWNVEIKTVHIAKEKNLHYPLKIKIDLAIAHADILPSKPHQPIHLSNTSSPFFMSRHVGNMIVNNKIIELIETGETQNILIIRKPVLD